MEEQNQSEKSLVEDKKEFDTNSDSSNSSKSEKDEKQSKNIINKGWFKNFVNFLRKKQVFSKLFVICFATFVFSYIYLNNETVSRDALAYIGLILYVVVCYAELIGIRDHLWVIEGSLPLQKKWRDAFFNPSTIRKHKIRKIIILFFAFLVFSAIYKFKLFHASRDTLTFLGVILMVTVVYYETLAVRDEIYLMTNSLKKIAKNKKKKKLLKREKNEK